MAERNGLVVSPEVYVPADALTYRTARSGGPGGQHVNKVETKVELRVPLDRIEGLGPGARHRLVLLAGKRLTQDGELVMSADESRHQFVNRQAVEEKLVGLIRQALVPPKPRKATKPTRGSQERRLVAKKQAGAKKKTRGSVRDD